MLGTDPDIRRLLALRAIEGGLLRLKWLAAATRFEIAMHRHDRALKAGFNPDQPRDDQGRWTDSGNATAADNTGTPANHPDDNVDARVQLAAGLSDDQLDLSVLAFVSMYCKGSINRVMPSQFFDATVAEVIAAAQQGDRDAATCLKLLSRDKYRK